MKQKRYELWFRDWCAGGLKDQSMTLAIRPGDRRAPNQKGTFAGEEIYLRVIKVPGDEASGKLPEFSREKIEAVITRIFVSRWSDVYDNNLVWASPDATTVKGAKEQLRQIYGYWPQDDDLVSLIHFRYALGMNHVQELIDTKVVSVGIKAAENPGQLPFTHFACGIAGKDYPAVTPMLWNEAYMRLGLSERNVRLIGSPDDVEKILSTFLADGSYLGGDVGFGFKEKAVSYVQKLDPLAKAMGAINVIVKDGNELVGYNTDGVGYVMSLKQKLQEVGKEISSSKVIILGAGGTASAIALALAQVGVRAIVIVNRTYEKGVELAKRVNDFSGTRLATPAHRFSIIQLASQADVLVSVIDDPTSELDAYCALGEINLPASEQALATNIATANEVFAVLQPKTIISDVMLRNSETATIKMASEKGFATLDGKPMVLNQAIKAFCLVNQKLLTRLNKTEADVARFMRESDI